MKDKAAEFRKLLANDTPAQGPAICVTLCECTLRTTLGEVLRQSRLYAETRVSKPFRQIYLHAAAMAVNALTKGLDDARAAKGLPPFVQECK